MIANTFRCAFIENGEFPIERNSLLKLLSDDLTTSDGNGVAVYTILSL